MSDEVSETEISRKDAFEDALYAGRGTQYALIVTQSFTALLIAVCLNTCDQGWTQQRTKRLVAAANHSCKTCLVDDEDCGIRPTDEYSSARGFASCRELKIHYEARLRFHEDEVMSIPVPLTGLRVDVNWLALLTGVGIITLLGWLSLALRRECNLLDALHARDLSQSRRLVRMQFFTPLLGQGSVGLLWLVHFYVVVKDLATWGRGSSIGRGLMVTDQVVSVLLLMATGILGAECLKRLARLKSAWVSIQGASANSAGSDGSPG